MKKLFLAAALIAGGLSLAATGTPLMAQGGGTGGAGGAGGASAGAGGDVATPQKSVPRAGTAKRDDSMNAGQSKSRKHAHSKKKKMKHRMVKQAT